MARQKVLGMGMEALYYENAENQTAQTLKLTEIFPNKAQPRKDFDDKALEALADSIKQHGVLQPILVRPLQTGGYQIVAGERRWRASRLAGLEEVPVYVRDIDDRQAARLALVENLQREDLNPIEEALGYKQLMDESGASQEEISKVVGKSRSAVANSIRLLGLDPKLLDLVKRGEVSPGHARALLAVEDISQRDEIAQRVKNGELSVRQVEELVKRLPKEKPAPKPQKKRNSFYHEVEISLRETAGRVCTVRENKKGGGTMTVEFYGTEDLSALAKAIGEIGKAGAAIKNKERKK